MQAIVRKVSRGTKKRAKYYRKQQIVPKKVTKDTKKIANITQKKGTKKSTKDYKIVSTKCF